VRAIQITEFGGPEVLTPADLPEPQAVDGATLVDVTSAGVNYADTHQAEDSYLSPQRLPPVPGAEVAADTSGCQDAAGVTALLLDANDGTGVDVVLEMTGGQVLDGSLDALAPFGRLVAYGMASRTSPQPVHPGALMATSRALVGFWLVHCLRRPGGLHPAMIELLSLLHAGVLHPVAGGRYPLPDAARAHRDIRSRATTGKLVLDVRA